MKVTIIDYKAGNIESVYNAIASLNLGYEIVISDKPQDVKSANYVILPGVGAFADCMEGLKHSEGLIAEMRNHAINQQKPFLGICVGMQVLASTGFENGEHQGLGFIDGKVVKIEAKEDLKVPHMGWNSLNINDTQIKHPLLKTIKNGDHVYFANSYHFICQNAGNVVASVDYSQKINAIIVKKNIAGFQFHPEKSGEVGLKLLKNFLEWRY